MQINQEPRALGLLVGLVRYSKNEGGVDRHEDTQSVFSLHRPAAQLRYRNRFAEQGLSGRRAQRHREFGAVSDSSVSSQPRQARISPALGFL